MREIKFRAWTGNRMIDFKEVRDMHATPWNSTSLKWMQFTGLKDKNGKEIYEGDIVEFENGVWKIYFAEGAAQFRYETLQEDDFMDMSEGDNCEIIGNIYENPELIKEKV